MACHYCAFDLPGIVVCREEAVAEADMVVEAVSSVGRKQASAAVYPDQAAAVADASFSFQYS